MTTTTMPYHEILAVNIEQDFWGDSATEYLIEEHLTFVAEEELREESYEFDIIRFYVRKSDGMVLTVTDSGCSCPTPFEDYKVADLIEIKAASIPAIIREEGALSPQRLQEIGQRVKREVIEAGGQ